MEFKMKTKILFLLIILFSLSSNAQIKSNSIYFELFGNGGLYSINYDRLITENLGGRIGFMYLPSIDFVITSAENIIVVPLMVNYFAGDNNKLELGAGIIYVSIDNVGFLGFESGEGGSGVVGTAVFGYRYQPKDGGFLFRIGLTPFFSGNGAAVSGGLSIGFSF
jgi:hypothetical protein